MANATAVLLVIFALPDYGDFEALLTFCGDDLFAGPSISELFFIFIVAFVYVLQSHLSLPLPLPHRSVSQFSVP